MPTESGAAAPAEPAPATACARDAERVLVLPPTQRDGEVTRRLIERLGVPCTVCRDPRHLAEEIGAGVGTILMSEAALADPGIEAVAAALREQPPWSDVAIVLLMRDREHSPAAGRALATLPNVTLLDRPASTRSVLSAVRAVLGARRRQYQLRDRIDEQARTAQALREADRRKNEFLAMLSHELRNPLAPLTNALRLLERREALSADGAAALSMAQRQTRQLQRLVDDLLEVSRVSRGKIALQLGPVSLQASVRDAVESVAADAQARRHRVLVELPREPVAVRADAARLAQILENLLGNAFKYTPDGGTIRVAGRALPDAAEIRVIDDGVGIAASELPKLFELFSQIDATIERSRGGLGIGLALVKRLAELHGGSVRAESPGPGQGSTFVLRLPRAPAPGDAPRAPAAEG